MLKVGLTGGIGSGKSTIAKIFATLKIPVYNSDDRAKWLMTNDPHLVKEIINSFGEESYIDGNLNRSFLATEVFSNKNKLTELNKLVHPRVANDFKTWLSYQNSNIIIKEAAILIESGAYKELDKIIAVSAPEFIRIQRVIKRDNVSEEEVRRRMQNQLTDKERASFADYIIYNDEEHLLIPQVNQVLNELKKLL